MRLKNRILLGISLLIAATAYGSAYYGSGNFVVGPTSATDNGIARFDGPSGHIIQGSSASLDDNGTITAEYAYRFSTKTATFTISAGDQFSVYLCNHSAAITANLPSASSVTSGFVINIKDISGNASVNTITIDPNGSQTIDGALTYIISIDRENIKIMSDGSNWVIL